MKQFNFDNSNNAILVASLVAVAGIFVLTALWQTSQVEHLKGQLSTLTRALVDATSRAEKAEKLHTSCVAEQADCSDRLEFCEKQVKICKGEYKHSEQTEKSIRDMRAIAEWIKTLPPRIWSLTKSVQLVDKLRDGQKIEE